MILQGIAGATGVSNFLRAFLMVSLNSVSSEVDEIDSSSIFVRFPDGASHSTTFAFPSAWRALPIVFQISGHK